LEVSRSKVEIRYAGHANVGSLAMDDATQAQIDEAYDQILFLRQTLLKAFGMQG